MTQEVLAVGADGIPNGWVAAVCRGPAGGSTPEPCDLHTELLRFGSVGELVDWRNEHACGATAGVDVPMGLLENGGPRPCDQDARRLLQRRASSVFTPPGRYLLEAMRKADHAARWTEAQRLVRERGAVGISRQTLGIMGKIKEADDHLRARPEDQAWLIEVHPELSFLELSEAIPCPDRSAARPACCAASISSPAPSSTSASGSRRSNSRRA